MSRSRVTVTWRPLVAMACVVVLAGACGGGDGDSGDGGAGGSGSPDAPGDGGGAAAGEEPLPELACSDEIRRRLPDGFDPDTCWVVGGPTDPVVVGDRVFALVPVDKSPADGSAAPLVVGGYDAVTGAQVWASSPLPGEVHRLAAVDVGGDPGVAVVVSEPDEGDAVTAPSVAWGYYAWHADVDEDSPSAPAARASGPTDLDSTSFADILWTDQGLLAGDRLLGPEADEFVPVVLDVEPVVIDEVYDLGESPVGVSGGGELLLSYVSDVAYPSGGPDDGSTYVGWVARGLDGTTAWDAVTSFPNEGDVAIFAEGPARMPIVVGDHALTITATDETYAEFTAEWLDAATGEPAEPAADDLAGTVPVGGQADVIAGDITTLLSPDGRHLFAQWSTLALIVDVEAGTVTRVASDFDIHGTAIDDTAVYGTTENGNLTIDLATAEARAQAEGTLAVHDVVGDVAVFVVDDPDDITAPDQLVTAHRES